ncbi:MAG: hypothetical protein ACREMY_27875, partial [bacterium]
TVQRYQLGEASARNSSRLRRPYPSQLKLFHGFIRELRAWTIAADDEHQDVFLVRIAGRHVLKATAGSRWKCDHVERIE